MESRKRTVVKAIVWNLIGLAMMAVVGLIYTGSLAIGGTLAVTNAAIGLASYVIYERVWAGISWGRFG
jgi:uncharacterized membrane protein